MTNLWCLDEHQYTCFLFDCSSSMRSLLQDWSWCTHDTVFLVQRQRGLFCVVLFFFLCFSSWLSFFLCCICFSCSCFVLYFSSVVLLHFFFLCWIATSSQEEEEVQHLYNNNNRPFAQQYRPPYRDSLFQHTSICRLTLKINLQGPALWTVGVCISVYCLLELHVTIWLED